MNENKQLNKESQEEQSFLYAESRSPWGMFFGGIVAFILGVILALILDEKMMYCVAITGIFAFFYSLGIMAKNEQLTIDKHGKFLIKNDDDGKESFSILLKKYHMIIGVILFLKGIRETVLC